MEIFFLTSFIVLFISIPIAYRYIRLGQFWWFSKNKMILVNNSNYYTAEKFRVIQVLLGSVLFFIHGVIFWGLFNIIMFFCITVIISFFAEIIGSKTGYFFGGKYQYNIDNVPGYVFHGVPLLIPIAWFGIIYTGMNFCYLITGIQFPFDTFTNNYFYIILSSFLVMLLDTILDPIAVDEKRWRWDNPGMYYGVPILNFLGWFAVSIIILILFLHFSKPEYISNSFLFLFQYFPGFLFMLLPAIASRPCFERDLRFPGYFGMFLSIIYFILYFL